MIRHRWTVAVLTLTLLGNAGAAWAQNTGSADFTRYVALGDSLTAGYSNGSLVVTHQATSLGAILFYQTGAGGTFEQPLILSPGLPTELELMSLSPLVVSPGPDQVELPNLDPTNPSTGSFPNIFLLRPYDNLGIPGMNVSNALNTTCERLDQNPFYCVVLRNPECAPVIADPVNGQCLTAAGGTTALQQSLYGDPANGIPQATFMTVWLGANDVLGAVQSGLVVEGVTITPLDEFTADYQQLIATLTAAGPDLAIANVPDATQAPYATTIPPFVVDPATGAPVLDPDTGEPVPLIGETTTGTRPLTSADQVLLPASYYLSLVPPVGVPASLGGTGTPLPDEVVLDESELAIIQQRIVDYNTVIQTEAQNAGAAYVDSYTRLNQVVQDGVLLGGVLFTTDYLSGGLFGYDGIHPTNLGYAVVSQWFVDAINATYGGSIAPIDLGPYVFAVPGNPVLPVSVGSFQFTPAEQNQALAALGLPDTETLKAIQIERRMQRLNHQRREPGRVGTRDPGMRRR